MQSLRVCVSKDPNLAECHYYLGVAVEQQALPQNALEHYSQALRVDPSNSLSFAALAGLYFALHDFERALAVADEGLHQVRPTEATAPTLIALHTIRGRIA